MKTIILQYNKTVVIYEEAQKVARSLEKAGYLVIMAATEGGDLSYKIIEVPQ